MFPKRGIRDRASEEGNKYDDTHQCRVDDVPYSAPPHVTTLLRLWSTLERPETHSERCIQRARTRRDGIKWERTIQSSAICSVTHIVSEKIEKRRANEKIGRKAGSSELA